MLTNLTLFVHCSTYQSWVSKHSQTAGSDCSVNGRRRLLHCLWNELHHQPCPCVQQPDQPLHTSELHCSTHQAKLWQWNTAADPRWWSITKYTKWVKQISERPHLVMCVWVFECNIVFITEDSSVHIVVSEQRLNPGPMSPGRRKW